MELKKGKDFLGDPHKPKRKCQKIIRQVLIVDRMLGKKIFATNAPVVRNIMTDFTPMPISDKQQLLVKRCEQFEDAIFILDDKLRYQSVNANYELMLGYTEKFWLGRPLGIYAAEFLS